MPDSKRAAPDKERPSKCHFEELHELFPELVDADGSGWFHRHVHRLARFVLNNPDKVRKTVIPKAEVIKTLVLYYAAHRQDDSDWVVLPTTNFKAYFGTAFGRKYLPKLPPEIFDRSDSGYGVGRYRVREEFLYQA